MKKIYIGIDPDVHKSGFAIWNNKTLELHLLRFFDVYNKMVSLVTLYGKSSIHVIIEGGHLNKKSNFHASKNKTISDRISKNVGMNHEVGMKLMEMMQHFNVSAEFKQPKKSKTSPVLFKIMTGIDTKDQEKIDAGMLVFGT